MKISKKDLIGFYVTLGFCVLMVIFTFMRIIDQQENYRHQIVRLKLELLDCQNYKWTNLRGKQS